MLYHIGIGVALVPGLGARQFLDREVIGFLLPVFFLGALGGTTFMFVAGMVLFEKCERTLDALTVTPLKTRDYLLSKLATLTAFGAVESLIVLLLAYGPADFNAAALLAGILIMGALYTLIGIAQVVRYDSVTEFLMPGAILVSAVLQLPFLHALDIWPSPIWYVVPTQAPLLLMKGAFRPIATWEWFYAIGYSVVGLAASYRLAEGQFTKYIVRGGR
jgi:fluoroquinolone transport system permease protein